MAPSTCRTTSPARCIGSPRPRETAGRIGAARLAHAPARVPQRIRSPTLSPDERADRARTGPRALRGARVLPLPRSGARRRGRDRGAAGGSRRPLRHRDALDATSPRPSRRCRASRSRPTSAATWRCSCSPRRVPRRRAAGTRGIPSSRRRADTRPASSSTSSAPITITMRVRICVFASSFGKSRCQISHPLASPASAAIFSTAR